MKYAIISFAGSQYEVQENQKITVNSLGLKDGETSTTDQVLLVADDDNVTIGQPTVPKASVEFKVIKSYPAKKMRVFKYKAKSRYRKTMGFRHQLTDIQINKIVISN